MARGWTKRGVEILGGIAENGTSESARVAAVGMLLDRGWGRAEQRHEHGGTNGEDIKVTIRTIIEGAKTPKK